MDEENSAEVPVLDESKPEHEQIIDLLVGRDDVTWKTIILELVNSNKMDPWHIDITKLTNGYITIMKELEEHDFRVSAKMILAAALLLKVKSTRLLEGDINALDELLASTEQSIEEAGLSDDDYSDIGLVDEVLPDEFSKLEPQALIPRMPKPRKRKVSIYDLVDALEKALEVKDRRLNRRMPSLEVEKPKKAIDLTVLMGHLHERINVMFGQEDKDKVFFTDLTPGTKREDKVMTFIPLLHLTNARKLDLLQDEHFGPIQVHMNEEQKKEAREELGA